MEQNIETRIIKAARETFLRKGYKETSMAEIAEEVGLTRPAMHYYFRTKERLFQAVLGEIIQIVLPKLKGIIVSDGTIREKVTNIVDIYIELIKYTPDVPLFIIKEINRDIDNMLSIASDTTIYSSARVIKECITKEMAEGRIKEMPIRNIVYTLYALLTFPILTKPLGKAIFDTDVMETEFLETWRNNIISQMTYLLSPDDDKK